MSRFAGLLPNNGRILDLACGAGRHTRLLLELGFSVTAADKDLSGVNDLRGKTGLTLLSADLESDRWPFDHEEFSGIVVTNYLYRPIFPHLVTSLAPNGVLIYETFAVGHEKFGRPRNPDYLLRPNELRDVFSGLLDVVEFEQAVELSPVPAVRQRICAMRPPSG